MAKKSQRRSLQYEKDQAGCMWSFISIFDFRRGMSTRKLLSDRRRASRQVGAASSPKLTVQDPSAKSLTVEDDEEREVETLDVKTRVKELMEEDMFSHKNPRNEAEIEPELLYPHQASHRIKTLKKTYKASKRSRNLSLSDLDDFHKLRKNDNLFAAMEELDQDSVKNGAENLHTESDQAYPVLEEKLSAAIEVFMNHKLKNSKLLREDEITDNTKELTDALQTLRSNKELFRRLLQDPNSKLVKRIESLEDGLNKGLKSNFPEIKPISAKTDEVIGHKQPYFLRRRSKSQGSFPLMDDVRPQTSSKIVILKPGPVEFRGSTQLSVGPSSHTAPFLNNKAESERHSSYFSFTEIKRKLKHAMGKDHRVPAEFKKRSDTEKWINGENAGWSSPNRNHFYTERFATVKRTKPKDVEETAMNEAKRGVPNIYLEAKKHIFEMLDSVEEKEASVDMHLPRSLGRILSLPDYYTSPSCSSSNSVNSDEQIVAANEHKDTPQSNSETHSNQDTESDKENPDVASEHNHDSSLEPIAPSSGDTEEPSQTRCSEENDSVPNASLEISSSSSTEACIEESSSQSSELDSEHLKPESQEVDKILSSPKASANLDTTIADQDCVTDRTERPSPVSVLEPLFAEDDISPASTVCRSVEIEIQPRKIHFEEPTYCAITQPLSTKTCLESEETAFEYVEAVLLGSDLNWDDFLLRWLSSDQILDPSLFDEVELFSSRSGHDQKILFDFTNEVLKEVVERYFGSFFIVKQNNVRPVPRGMDLINEVWGGVEWYLLKHPPPHLLDQLIRNDLSRSVEWMDLRFDTGDIGCEMELAILDELLEETISSLADEAKEIKICCE